MPQLQISCEPLLLLQKSTSTVLTSLWSIEMDMVEVPSHCGSDTPLARVGYSMVLLFVMHITSGHHQGVENNEYPPPLL